MMWWCCQLGPVLRGSAPSRRIVEGFSEETVHESGHRNAMTLGFMEERCDDRSRDDGHVVTCLSCHQGSLTRGGELLQGMAL